MAAERVVKRVVKPWEDLVHVHPPRAVLPVADPRQLDQHGARLAGRLPKELDLRPCEVAPAGDVLRGPLHRKVRAGRPVPVLGRHRRVRDAHQGPQNLLGVPGDDLRDALDQGVRNVVALVPQARSELRKHRHPLVLRKGQRFNLLDGEQKQLVRERGVPLQLYGGLLRGPPPFLGGGHLPLPAAPPLLPRAALVLGFVGPNDFVKPGPKVKPERQQPGERLVDVLAAPPKALPVVVNDKLDNGFVHPRRRHAPAVVLPLQQKVVVLSQVKVPVAPPWA